MQYIYSIERTIFLISIIGGISLSFKYVCSPALAGLEREQSGVCRAAKKVYYREKVRSEKRIKYPCSSWQMGQTVGTMGPV